MGMLPGGAGKLINKFGGKLAGKIAQKVINTPLGTRFYECRYVELTTYIDTFPCASIFHVYTYNYAYAGQSVKNKLLAAGAKVAGKVVSKLGPKVGR